MAVGLYLAATVCIAALIHWLSDSWWLATVLLFAPRWVWGVPLPLLVIVAVMRRRRRLLAVLGAAALVVLLAIMDFELPSMGTSLAKRPARPVRIMTSNIGGGPNVPVETLLAAVESEGADLAAFQECRTRLEPLRPRGWHTHNAYEMCFLSRFPILDVKVRDSRDMWRMNGAGLMARYEVQGPEGPLHLVSVHLETVRPALAAAMRRLWRAAPVLRANIRQRRLESQVARDYVVATEPPVVVVGDFNMPVESAIYREFWSPFTNAFSRCGLGTGYTKHTSWHGVRIDHVLLGRGLECSRAWVGQRVGYDHLPVIAEVVAPTS